MFLIENKQLTPQEIEIMDLEFYSEIISDPQASEDVVNKFIEFFNNIPKNDDRKYWSGYFRWFTELIWRRLNSFSQDIVIDSAISRQIPMAILLDVDVWKEIMWYLAGRTSFQVLDLQDLYFRMRKSFLESEAVIGEWNGKNFTVHNAIEEIQKINLLENNSMAAAELFSKIENIFFPKNDPLFRQYITIDPTTVVDRFVGLIQFFLGIDEQNIWYVVEVFLHPNTAVAKETTAPAVVSPPTPTSKVFLPASVFASKPVASGEATAPVSATRPSASTVPTLKSVVPLKPTPPPVAPATPPVPPLGKRGIERPTPAQTPVVEPQARLTTGQVKSQIESQFKKDAAGNFADIEGVMAKLNELAEKNNDPKIAEMIYYDEKENKFKWNI